MDINSWKGFKFFYFIGGIAIIMAFILLLYVLVLLFYPFKTVEYKNQPFPIIGKEFRPGQVVPFTVNYCRYRTGYYYTIAGMSDGIVETLGTRSVISVPGCHIMESHSWKIPLNTPPGDYSLVFVSEFHIDTIRVIDIASKTQMFIVK